MLARSAEPVRHAGEASDQDATPFQQNETGFLRVRCTSGCSEWRLSVQEFVSAGSQQIQDATERGQNETRCRKKQCGYTGMHIFRLPAEMFGGAPGRQAVFEVLMTDLPRQSVQHGTSHPARTTDLEQNEMPVDENAKSGAPFQLRVIKLRDRNTFFVTDAWYEEAMGRKDAESGVLHVQCQCGSGCRAFRVPVEVLVTARDRLEKLAKADPEQRQEATECGQNGTRFKRGRHILVFPAELVWGLPGRQTIVELLVEQVKAHDSSRPAEVAD